MSDSLGLLFRVTSFGESHGSSIGVVVEGCPAGIELDAEAVQAELDRRVPSRQPGATPRREPDRVRIVSGLYRRHTTGAPVCMMVDNTCHESSSYKDLAVTPRPGHADYPAGVRYGGWNDPGGGGRFSGRITAGFVMAGAVAKAVLHTVGVEIYAHTVAIGDVVAPGCAPEEVASRHQTNSLSCCDDAVAAGMTKVIEEARAAGDSVGGVVECVALGLPPGMGEPVFAGVESEVARASTAITSEATVME